MTEELAIRVHVPDRGPIEGVLVRAGVDPLTAEDLAAPLLELVHPEPGRLEESAGDAPEKPWRILAAEWLEEIADAADAEGLTDPRLTEDRKMLAQLLRQEAEG